MIYLLIILVSVTIVAIYIQYLINKANCLQFELDIKNTENRSLKRVLAENDLIPKEMVK